MKIIFLDFDGVLNNIDHIRYVRQLYINKPSAHPEEEIMKEKVALVNQLDDAKVVISSYWRLIYPGLAGTYLKQMGLELEIIGETPNLEPDALRGTEIHEWLSAYGDYYNVTSYVIFDDRSEAGFGHPNNFIETDLFEGLTQEHISKAKIILNGQK